MDLRSPYPFWLLRHGIIHSYPSLQDEIKTEVAIIGAGISGALVAHSLLQAGFEVAMIDRRHAGMGSTAASTSLLQYELDTPLHQLAKKVGLYQAVEAYQLCRQSIYDLERICSELPEKDLLHKRPSFQFASFKKHVPALKEELRLRRDAGIKVDWLEDYEVKEMFDIEKPGGLLSADGAEADAYRITHALLQHGMSNGVRVYDNTEVISIRHLRKGVELLTADNKRVKARRLVIACGYESQQYIPKKIQELHATFAIVSEPGAVTEFWYKNALIWETAVPYLYLRTTKDRRVLAGGKDVPFSNPQKRDAILKTKAKQIEEAVCRLMPSLHIRTDFQWAGTFASTKDGMPYIGGIPERPHTYFALGFGGNGITFSVIAARAICDAIMGKRNRALELFSFKR